MKEYRTLREQSDYIDRRKSNTIKTVNKIPGRGRQGDEILYKDSIYRWLNEKWRKVSNLEDE